MTKRYTILDGGEADEAFKRQQTRPSNAEIASVAEKLWDDPHLGSLLRRVKLDEELAKEQEDDLTLFLENQQIGEMEDRRLSDLRLAVGLVRHVAAGLLPSFRGPAADVFIADRLLDMSDGALGHRPVPTPFDEVITLGRKMLCDSEIIELVHNIPERGQTAEQMDQILGYISKYRRTNSLENRGGFESVIRPLIWILRGEASGFDDPKVVSHILSDPKVLPPEGADS